jgi:hypothetical protein
MSSKSRLQGDLQHPVMILIMSLIKPPMPPEAAAMAAILDR